MVTSNFMNTETNNYKQQKNNYMKHLFLIFALMLTLFSTSASGGNVKLNVNVNDGKDSATVIGVVSDSDTIDGESDTVMYSKPLTSSTWYDSDSDWNSGQNAIPIVAIVTVFGLPVFIIAIFLWFRYKNNQAKYRLAAQALSGGQEIPNGLFKEPSKDDQIFNKKIKNAFLGIGLGVFLWLLTGTAGLAAIGFLIFCLGISQIIIGYSGRSREQNKVSELDKFKSDYMKRKVSEKVSEESKQEPSTDKQESQPSEKPSNMVDIVEDKEEKKWGRSTTLL